MKELTMDYLFSDRKARITFIMKLKQVNLSTVQYISSREDSCN